jgi:hypothetical protein
VLAQPTSRRPPGRWTISASGLTFAAWVAKQGEIVRNFRAQSVTVLADARRTQAV